MINERNPYWKKWLLAILAAGFVVRVIGLTRPLLGNFSSVQLTYAMMARNFREYSWNLFLPRMDLIVNGEPGIRLLDLPLISYGVALINLVLPLPIDLLGRAWSIVFSVASIYLVFLIAHQLFNKRLALFGAFFFAFSPLSIVYGQSFLTDATAVFLILVSVFCALQSGNGWFLISTLSFALSFLLRVQFIFIYPLFLLLNIQRSASLKQGIAQTALFVLISVMPVVLWNAYIYQALTEHFDSVIMSIYHQLGTKTYISYSPMSWMFAKGFLSHLIKLVLNPIGFALSVAGLFLVIKRRKWEMLFTWIIFLVLMLVFLTKKTIDMNYYLLGLAPPMAILAAVAWEAAAEKFGKTVQVLFYMVFTLVSLRYAVAPAFITPEEDKGVLDAAHFINQKTKRGDLIIASHGTNLDLLYYSGRKGWAFPVANRSEQSPYDWFMIPNRLLHPSKTKYLEIQADPILSLEYFREQGAKYFISAKPEELKKNEHLSQHLRKKYRLLGENTAFVIFEL